MFELLRFIYLALVLIPEMKKSKENSEHYNWGNNCNGWHLVKSENFWRLEEETQKEQNEKQLSKPWWKFW